MIEQRKKILDMFKTGLKAKEIATNLNIEHKLVSKIIKNEQRRIRRLKNPQKYRDSAKRTYLNHAVKDRKRAGKYYEEHHEDISNRTKEFRKTPEGQIYFRDKRQKEIARDPEGFKRKKEANRIKNFPKNKDRLNKKQTEDRIKRKKTVFEYYSKGKLVCSCCKLDGNYGMVVGLDFLTIDHIIPKREMEKDPEMIKMGYRASRKADPLCQWLITNNFPKGFQILCWNCNKAKGVLGKCPHQK
jgi:hypothetical protein